MPGSADFIQRAVHGLEAGGAAKWILRAVATLVVAGLCCFYLLHEFRGLAAAQGMDQAQIGRELIRGHGWATKFARPLAAGQLQKHGKEAGQRVWIDTYNAPLPPLVDALALLPVKGDLKMTPRDIIYVGDRAIAIMAMLFFVASVVVLFFLVRRLFDQQLALLCCGLVLVCDLIWQYALSGLPQMLLLFLFNLTLYLLIRAIEAQANGRRVGGWLATAGVGFGLLALTHALTLCIFLPALIFCALHFRPRIWAAILVLVPFLVIYTPWLVRNYLVCGNPGGVAIFSFFDQIGTSEAAHMRRLAIEYRSFSMGYWRGKVTGNVISQAGQIFHYFGWSIVALFFFATVLHPFRRIVTSATRWLVLVMWLGASLGMAFYGVTEEQGVAANQLHLLFIPIMTCFGLAYLLVQWNRFGIESRIARIGFLVALFFLCAVPMIFSTALGQPKGGVRWPPYVPPYIAVIGQWMAPEEITASDMPWAVAWYADRKAVWLPETIRDFTDDNDYKLFGGPINAVYLTPISGSQNTLRDILKGEYRDWAPVILRSVDLSKFPLKWGMLLGLDNECIFFSDHNRQQASSNP